MTGWLNLLGWVGATASVDFALGFRRAIRVYPKSYPLSKGNLTHE